MTTVTPPALPAQPTPFEVDLPAGGKLYVQSVEEVELWNTSFEKYVEDYHLSKQNDLVLLGALLQQQILLFRSQRAINGMVPQLDAQNRPTGVYIMKDVEPDEIASLMKALTGASDQIQKIEKSLGIDKVSRESGGQFTVADYVSTLKKAARMRGIHISRRVLAYEEVINQCRWRIRLLRNGDAEDRAYHDITPEKIIDWLESQLKELEGVDQKFAKEFGKLFVGKL
jgi:hypothetical protein